MKTAREMFREIGYGFKEYRSDEKIFQLEYFDDSREWGHKAIVFDLDKFNFYATDVYEPMDIDITTFKAIHQQMKELGWIEDRDTPKPPEFDKPLMVLGCPNCGHYLQKVVDDEGSTDGMIPHYCKNCGQKIDWRGKKDVD